MKRRNLQQRPDQHREQNLPEWLFFHFGPVIGVGIVALNHNRLQYHHSVIYSNYISMLYGLMAESINPEMCDFRYRNKNLLMMALLHLLVVQPSGR